TVSGLASGRYEAKLQTHEGSGGSEIFEIEPQQILNLSIRKPNVLVDGHLSLNQKPLGDMSIRITRTDGGGSVQVTTDDAGMFRVNLDRPGYYNVMLADGNLASAMRPARFHEG